MDERVREILSRLHTESDRQTPLLFLELARFLPRILLERRIPWNALESRMDTKYLAISPSQGMFCYLMAKAVGARNIVEFGTSFGVSTIYLALAVKENGGGRVIGTELVEEKALMARRNLAESGLEDFVDIRVGDALETLREIDEPIDFFLNDGFPSKALPVLQLVKPRLRSGALVVTDNVGAMEKEYRSYVEYLRDPQNGFQSALIKLERGTELSVKC